MQDLLDQISDTMVTILDAENCMIFLEDKEKEPGILKCVSASGHAKSILGVEYKTGEGFTGSIFESGLEFNLKSRAELESIEIDGKKNGEANSITPSGRAELVNTRMVLGCL